MKWEYAVLDAVKKITLTGGEVHIVINKRAPNIRIPIIKIYKDNSKVLEEFTVQVDD